MYINQQPCQACVTHRIARWTLYARHWVVWGWPARYAIGTMSQCLWCVCRAVPGVCVRRRLLCRAVEDAYTSDIYIYGEVEDMGCARWVCIVLEVVGRLRAIMYTMCIPKRNNVVVVWWQKFCLFSQTDIVFARYTAHVCIWVYVWVCRYTRWHLWH